VPTHDKPLSQPLTHQQAAGGGAATLGAFHLAQCPGLGALIWLFLLGVCVLALRWQASGRAAFYGGLGFGLALYVPQLWFFWTIFGPPGAVLWLIIAFWIGLFFLMMDQCRARCGPAWAAVLLPFVSTGLEYFRSELYYLRFSWLMPAYALAEGKEMRWLLGAGAYGFGFFALALFGALLAGRRRPLLALAALASWAGLYLGLDFAHRRAVSGAPETSPPALGKGAGGLGRVTVAGLQLEFPSQREILTGLGRLLAKYPQAELLVLSEYTLDGPVPEELQRWCREHGRYVVVGGKAPASSGDFYNTAFVVGPAGKIVFAQAKSVPIQFFKDGLPAPCQSVWNSPWGKLGICVCYDLSYTRVTDELVRQGARALIVPSMDVAFWAKREHELHARVTPVRAAEYGLPIFRVASSGISQLVDAAGNVQAEAPFPGEGQMIGGELALAAAGRLPLDRWLAPLGVGVAGLTALWLLIRAGADWLQRARLCRREKDEPRQDPKV
jgi:apolipoprotein N-acyltransferase